MGAVIVWDWESSELANYPLSGFRDERVLFCEMILTDNAACWRNYLETGSEAAFAEVARVLAPDGLFLFSTLGPDTLKELRAAFSDPGDARHVNPFVDMHDLGDALVHAGFADPVMEMEVITLEYASLRAVVADLRAIGASNALPDRPRGLGGRARWREAEARYERHRRDGVLPATYEVVYGHAWRSAPRTAADGRAIVQFQARRTA